MVASKGAEAPLTLYNIRQRLSIMQSTNKHELFIQYTILNMCEIYDKLKLKSYCYARRLYHEGRHMEKSHFTSN